MQKFNNVEIRQEIERKRLHYYEVADALNINPCTLSRWLEKELSDDRKESVMNAIKNIKI